MLNHRPVRIRVIALIVAIAALIGYFAGRTGAQSLERQDGPEFLMRSGWTDQNYGYILKIYHPRTQTCWIFLKEGYGGGMAEAPREVCK